MNTRLHLAALAAVLTLIPPTLRAQVPQLINYQGRVAVGTTNFDSPPSGLFKFALVDAAGTTTYWSNDGTSTAGSQPTAAVALTVTKGLYSVLLGDATLANMTVVPATVFANTDVRLRVWFDDGTNGSQLLTPDQRIAAVGYAMIAASAQTVSDGAITAAKMAAGSVTTAKIAAGAVTNTQLATGAVANANLANSGITITAGTGLSGGGAVSLGGTVSLTNAGVRSLTGGGGITVNAATGTITLGSTATSANTASTLVLRDASGNFSAGTITGTFSGNGAGLVGVPAGSVTGVLSLPITTGPSVGVITQNGNRLLHTYGINNTFTGSGAGNFNMTGGGNTGSGVSALFSNTTGVNNTAIGLGALSINTSGNQNTATGTSALANNSGGSDNTAIGVSALQGNTTGNRNTASGSSALGVNTVGTDNTANGFSALQANTTGSQNTASGVRTLQLNTTGSNNTAIGVSALSSNTTGYQNTATGSDALASNTTGINNAAYGYLALVSNTTGYANTAAGVGALNSNSTGSSNTASGLYALHFNTTGSNNTASGQGSLSSSTTGDGNIAIGYQAGSNLTTGSNNIAIGHPGVAGEAKTIRIGTPGVQTATYIAGRLTVPVLSITGGADVAEPFLMSDKEIPKGAVVVIDEKNSGELKLSEQAYDQRVAGIVSGANGINPGIALHQEGALEGGQNVSLSGRVYVLADAAFGSIRPGDLLTTSDTPGHAMKATDQNRAQGAVLGKAMSSLDEGQGMVLVLVTLQ